MECSSPVMMRCNLVVVDSVTVGDDSYFIMDSLSDW